MLLKRLFKKPPGAYELSDIANVIKEETNANIIIDADENTLKGISDSKILLILKLLIQQHRYPFLRILIIQQVKIQLIGGLI